MAVARLIQMSRTQAHRIRKAHLLQVQPVKLFNPDGTGNVERGVTEA